MELTPHKAEQTQHGTELQQREKGNEEKQAYKTAE